MNKALRALAALLGYPERDLIEALPEIRLALAAGRLRTDGLLGELAALELYVLQERYVALFDRSRALSLHLFEHVHGESRDRGQAMVDLQAMYTQRGMQVADGELPDYVPAFLEFLSLVGEREAKGLLAETAHILRAIGEALARRGSPYAEVFGALLALAGERGIEVPSGPRPEDEDSPEALDRAWLDAPVTFGGPQPVKFYRNGVAT